MSEKANSASNVEVLKAKLLKLPEDDRAKVLTRAMQTLPPHARIEIATAAGVSVGINKEIATAAGGSIEQLAKADPTDIQRIAALQISLLFDFYKDVLDQARRSFN